jgi:hypothetical protein
MPPYTPAEAKDWARENFRGVYNVIIPSYTNDLADINEQAIRHDVRRNIEFGFAGTLLVSETNITLDEYTRFVEIAADEAKGRMTLIHHAAFNTLEQNIEAANRAVTAGADLALLAYPPSFYPGSERDIYDYSKAFCDGTSIATMLFPVPLWGFERLHPASISVDTLEQLVDDVPNVVAIKAEGGLRPRVDPAGGPHRGRDADHRGRHLARGPGTAAGDRDVQHRVLQLDGPHHAGPGAERQAQRGAQPAVADLARLEGERERGAHSRRARGAPDGLEVPGVAGRL